MVNLCFAARESVIRLRIHPQVLSEPKPNKEDLELLHFLQIVFDRNDQDLGIKLTIRLVFDYQRGKSDWTKPNFDTPLSNSSVMALALRFAEEGEFRSRAFDLSSIEAPDVAPSKAIFRWSRSVRQFFGPQVHDAVKVKTLVVAMPGAPQQFVQQLTTAWTVVGTLLTTDQVIQPCKLQGEPSMGVILSKMGRKVSDEGNCLALLVGQEVPAAATWEWLDQLRSHVDAEEIVCLDSQLSTIYTDQYEDGQIGAKLRMLATSTVTEELKLQTPVRTLEVPQFVIGIPAALLTHGELRKRCVRVFVSLRDVATTPLDVVQSFLPLTASSASVLSALERPRSFQPTGDSMHQDRTVGVLYT